MILTEAEWVLVTASFVLFAVFTFMIAEIFRRKVVIAFYVYLSLFVGFVPLLFYPLIVPTFVIIKYFIVGIPYLLLLMMIMVNSSSTNIIPTFSKRILKLNIHLSQETGDKYAYKPYISWFWWLSVVINILVAVKEDITDGSITNAVCGILLCVPFSFPIPIKSLSVTRNPIGEYYSSANQDESIFEFHQDGLSLLWIITYTSWNYCLLFGQNGLLYQLWIGFVHLWVPLFRSILYKRTDLWLSYRGISLSFALMLSTTLRQIDVFRYDEVVIYDKDVDEKKYHLFLIWGAVNCIGAIINIITQFIAFQKPKRKEDYPMVSVHDY